METNNIDRRVEPYFEKTNNEMKNSEQSIIRTAITEEYPKFILYSNGGVFNTITQKWQNANNVSNKYLVVGLINRHGEREVKLVHRLMYETFIGEIPEGMQINHKDENKANNLILFDKKGEITYTNLELVTPKENCNYGKRNQKISDCHNGKKKTKIPFIVKVTNNGEVTTYEFKSISRMLEVFPTLNRATLHYRLNKSKKPKESWIQFLESGEKLEITPLSNDYKQKVEEYKLMKEEE